ncbi:MAG: cyclic nucleotide-binding domain-containing protein [Agarilytica sp.]
MTFEVLSNSYGKLVLDAIDTASTLVPLKSLRPSFLEDLFRQAAVQTVFAGEVIFEDGAYDHQHIYLQSGEARLQWPNGRELDIQSQDTCLPLAHHQPRMARCLALTDCTILRIDSDRVDRTLSWSQIADYLLSELSTVREYDEDIEWMQTVLNSNLFLKAPPVNAEQIFSRLTPMVVEEGEVIIRQGEMGDCCYFIKSGDAKVTVIDEENARPELLAEIGPGRCFGEDALVNEAVRNATVTMKSSGILMRLEKSDFLLLLQNPAVDEISKAEIGGLIEPPIYVDVRTEDEYAAGHLAYSANIPLSLLSIKKRLLAEEKPHIFYCDTGRRSSAAAYLLGKEGFNVTALKDGLIGQSMDDDLVQGENYILRNGELISGQ